MNAIGARSYAQESLLPDGQALVELRSDGQRDTRSPSMLTLAEPGISSARACLLALHCSQIVVGPPPKRTGR